MIKTRGVLFLDGDFAKAQPTHEIYTARNGDGWMVFKVGPKYSNTYEVVEFDAEGLKVLQSKERSSEGSQAP